MWRVRIEKVHRMRLKQHTWRPGSVVLSLERLSKPLVSWFIILDSCLGPGVQDRTVDWGYLSEDVWSWWWMCQLECRIQPSSPACTSLRCHPAIEELFKLISNSDRLEQHKQKLRENQWEYSEPVNPFIVISDIREMISMERKTHWYPMKRERIFKRKKYILELLSIYSETNLKLIGHPKYFVLVVFFLSLYFPGIISHERRGRMLKKIIPESFFHLLDRSVLGWLGLTAITSSFSRVNVVSPPHSLLPNISGYFWIAQSDFRLPGVGSIFIRIEKNQSCLYNLGKDNETIIKP